MLIYSQNGEDAVLAWILRMLDRVHSPYNKTYLEIGVSQETGYIECNTGRLLQAGWTGTWIDKDPVSYVDAKQEFVTCENIEKILLKYEVPYDLGVFSIDIDGNDYWIWKAMSREYQPSVVIIEYNTQILGSSNLVVPYDPKFKWDGTDYFGASANALVFLAHTKGYKLVTDCRHVNLFFVKERLLPSDWIEPDLGSLVGPIVSIHPPDPLNRKYQVIPCPR